MYVKNGISVFCGLVALRCGNALLRQQRDVLKIWLSDVWDCRGGCIPRVVNRAQPGVISLDKPTTLIAFQTWATHLLRQVTGVNPFAGDCLPTRVPLFGFGRQALPFPHLWNYKDPLKIFETFYCGAEKERSEGYECL